MSRAAIARAGLVSLALTIGMAALSQVPYTPVDTQNAVIRVSWRYRGQAVETCRALSTEERAARPIHMQQDTVCLGGVPPYRLQVDVDEQARADTVVVAAGARQDRPIFVFREFEVAPGEHRIAVRFATTEPVNGIVTREGLTLERPVHLAAGDVALVTYDAVEDRLVLLPR